MASASVVPNINRLVLNVGSGTETAVNEIVSMVIDTTETQPEIVYNKTHDEGPSRMCADLTAAKKKLKYVPRISLKEGLEKTVALDARFQK